MGMRKPGGMKLCGLLPRAVRRLIPTISRCKSRRVLSLALPLCLLPFALPLSLPAPDPVRGAEERFFCCGLA